jgi:hypothetical protein
MKRRNRSIIIGNQRSLVSGRLNVTYDLLKRKQPADHVLLEGGTSKRLIEYINVSDTSKTIPSDIFINKEVLSEDMLISFIHDDTDNTPENAEAIKNFESIFGEMSNTLPCRFMMYSDWRLTIDKYMNHYNPDNPEISEPIGVLYTDEPEYEHSARILTELVLLNKDTVGFGNVGYMNEYNVCMIPNKHDVIGELLNAIKDAAAPSLAKWYGILKMMNDPKFKDLFFNEETLSKKGVSKVRKHVLLPEDFDDDDMDELDE